VYNIWEYIYIHIYIYTYNIYIYISNFEYRLKIGDGEPYRMMSPCWKGRHRNSRNSLQPGQPSGSRERHRLIPSNPKKETFITGHLRNLNWRYLPYIRPIFPLILDPHESWKRYPPMSSNVAGWEIPYFYGAFNGEVIIFKYHEGMTRGNVSPGLLTSHLETSPGL